MKRTKTIRMSARILATLCALILSFVGCSTPAQDKSGDAGEVMSSEARYSLDPNTPAWKLDTQGMTELTWYVNAEWWNTDWGNDTITKQIEKDLNVKITFRIGNDTTLNTLFAGDKLPDIISIFDSRNSAVLKADTWALPLLEVADMYDPYFRKVAQEETLDWLQLGNGKSYAYANYSNTQTDYDSGMLFATTAFIIRNDVYEAIGKPSMKTQEEFLDALNKIKTQFPELYTFGFDNMDVNSVGSMGNVFQDYIGVPLSDEDGNFYNRDIDEDYLSWVRTFNQAYLNGYISDDSFADDETIYEEKVRSGKYACIMMNRIPQHSGVLTSWMNNNPDGRYIAIDGPQSTVGRTPTLDQAGISGWTLNYISKDCKDPAKAIQIFTYLLDEPGQILTNYGIEGETYTIGSDGKYALTPEVKEMQLSNNDQFKKQYRLGEFFFFGHDKYKALSDDAYPESIKQMQEWGIGKLYPHFILESIEPDAGTPEARTVSALNNEWATVFVTLLRSSNEQEFETTLQNYINFLNDSGYDKITEIRSGKMKINAQKLGL